VVSRCSLIRMRGTVILLADDRTPLAIDVIEEVADAARMLEPDGVQLTCLVVDAGADPVPVSAACDRAAQFGLKVDNVESPSNRAWDIQRAGFTHAIERDHPDFLVTLDLAGHHDARQLPQLVRSFRSTGSGLTVGSRWVRGGSAPGTPAARGWLSRLASRLVARATGLRRVRDVTTSFRVIRPDAAELVTTDPASHGDYGFFCEFAAVAQAYGFTVDEVPITFHPRFAALPRLRPSDLFTFWTDLRRIRRRISTIRHEMAIDQATWAARSGLLRHQDPETGSEFGALEELTELSGAQRFTNWIVDVFDDHLGDRILEVGAGIGAVALIVADRLPTSEVVAIEPADNVFDLLAERAMHAPNLTAYQVTSGELVRSGHHAQFDSVLYVNVLEHIKKDDAELLTARELLTPGGTIGIFVPAMPSLYGSLDYKSGHYRRYSPDQLANLLEEAGYVDVDVRYLDLFGVAPYGLMYRVLNVQRLDRVSAGGYDQVIVPMSRLLQRLVARPPRGKNLVATARRPQP